MRLASTALIELGYTSDDSALNTIPGDSNPTA